MTILVCVVAGAALGFPDHGKDIPYRFDFRQDVDNTVRAGEGFEYNLFVEFYRDIDTAVGNSIVEGGRRR